MRWWWFVCKAIVRLCGGVAWQLKVHGGSNVPLKGGVLLAATHQSFLDPPIVATCLSREMHFMARRTLFEIPVLRSLIVACNAFPIERDTRDVKGVKSAIERLRAGNILLLFPEGTRTRDGRIGPMKAGVRLLAERAAVPVVPVLVDGTYKVWPKGQALPALSGRIDVAFGRPFHVGDHPDLERKLRSDLLELKRSFGHLRPDEMKEMTANVQPQAGA